jgi:hypothetical protein
MAEVGVPVEICCMYKLDQVEYQLKELKAVVLDIYARQKQACDAVSLLNEQFRDYKEVHSSRSRCKTMALQVCLCCSMLLSSFLYYIVHRLLFFIKENQISTSF